MLGVMHSESLRSGDKAKGAQCKSEMRKRRTPMRSDRVVPLRTLITSRTLQRVAFGTTPKHMHLGTVIVMYQGSLVARLVERIDSAQHCGLSSDLVRRVPR